MEKVKSRWTRSFFTALNRKNDEEKYICDTCHKDLASPSNLALHRNTHVIERPFKCEPCQVSFNTQGHLQKHRRSSAHETRVTMTQAFGVPTSDNPRPYGCPECEVAFRKHGHLAKHLRSKSHITKMETIGLVPQGTYAAFEKCSTELKDKLVTTNCELSLISLRSIAGDILAPQAHQQQLQQSHPPLTSQPVQLQNSAAVSPLLDHSGDQLQEEPLELIANNNSNQKQLPPSLVTPQQLTLHPPRLPATPPLPPPTHLDHDQNNQLS